MLTFILKWAALRFKVYVVIIRAGDARVDCGRVASISLKQPSNVHRKWPAHIFRVSFCL